MEESAHKGVAGDFQGALEKAKECGKRERQLVKHREQHGLMEAVNQDLTYAVCFNLASCYQKNKMWSDALNTYSTIVKNKQYPHAGRLRVNMGNIFFEQKKWVRLDPLLDPPRPPPRLLPAL